MRYVIIRDDDTNALTPPEYLERLYRPFLERGLPVNLATIPNVRTDITYGAGIPEGFLVSRRTACDRYVPVHRNEELIQYLLANPGFEIVQHGYSHEFVEGRCEFEQQDRGEIVRRIDHGRALLGEAGFAEPETFVAPYDRFTRTSLREAACRFRVVSSNWYELAWLPWHWWPRYAWKKLRRMDHWAVGTTRLLTHPGCHLSFRRPLDNMLESIRKSIESRQLTVLVTHWWEYFADNQPNDTFISVLHETAAMLANDREFRVIKFSELTAGRREERLPKR
jgi:hypothetical protein